MIIFVVIFSFDESDNRVLNFKKYWEQQIQVRQVIFVYLYKGILALELQGIAQ